MDTNSATGLLNRRAKNAIAPQPVVKDENNSDIIAQNEEDDPSICKPRPRLPHPNVHMRNMASLIKELEDGTINVDPEYQREVVWTADRMTGLIDSLMENYYIPPIILNKKTDLITDTKRTRPTFVCVDGKQQTQKLFLEKEFVTFQFSELTQEQEEDLFARVQMGVQLSAAEKIRAKSGPWQELAKLFVQDFPVIYDLMKDRSRAKDSQITMACFSQIVEVKNSRTTNGSGIPVFKAAYNAVPKLLDNAQAVNDATKSHLAAVWKIFSKLAELDPDIFTNANKYLRGVQTFAPVEMVGVAVLISMYLEVGHQILLRDIRIIRETLRESFSDLRLNHHVWKFMWEIIDGLQAIHGGVENGITEKPPASTGSGSASDIQSSISAKVLLDGFKKRLAPETLSKATSLSQRTAVEAESSKAPPMKRRRKDLKTADATVSNNPPSNNVISQTMGSVPLYPSRMATAHSEGDGAFTPDHTEKEMEGVIIPASPQSPITSGLDIPAVTRRVSPSSLGSSAPRVRPKPITKRRMPVSRPTKEQMSEAIDLTGDA
ncbi:hypothetical protein COCC4DRAFT_122451 [Bipolaris maydis ATCC 48331]|uniref:GmrSD restriction endonucleases N-terminal domain-containing protein n=2 Tax=Cochliobolus heterostrophus TaxID=5016 RepID=M2TF26_COCH5|nr:uncharacterized protein COCC4DRAFT_122451 [Bipolaris maydis ATCC 48331]EMD96055.1 hypothetical protein COCHEDRAFT_1210302 [Bipolaris maydis C5]KAJ5030749.1 hypothetical protein J3E73DRAFT_405222 [Bipolaris maydis]ENI10915.1 hypothetical protein COCC4DRAFT_122451 [Bipolaris maydis ATCC 48331]KAJ6213168.1 hypothetical protein PSV09DRAFT_1210302 [Bipolaris maydis]KAJ6274416.1 hypothetical protein PSV08DRAFT_383872 [Bipolaris maydis]